MQSVYIPPYTTHSTSGEERVTSELIQDALRLERLDDLLFRSVKLWKPRGGHGVFGGQVIGQSAWAATQVYFLAFGNAEIPILYHVEKLRDGRSYTTRSVKAIQRGTVIFCMMCSFNVPEEYTLYHQVDPLVYPAIMKKGKKKTAESNNDTSPVQSSGPPAVGNIESAAKAISLLPSPEECLPNEERMLRILEMGGDDLSIKVQEYLRRNIDERRQSSIELRTIDPRDSGLLASSSNSKNSRASREKSSRTSSPSSANAQWLRSRASAGNDPRFQKCVLAYASDFNFIMTAPSSLGLRRAGDDKLGMLASLDHSMYFYGNDFDVNEWMLFSMDSPRVGEGRGIVSGRIYTRTGSLVVVAIQEGVVRPKRSTKL